MPMDDADLFRVAFGVLQQDRERVLHDLEKKEDAARQERAASQQFARGIIADYAKIYHEAPTLAMKEHYKNMLEQTVSILPQLDQKALAPLVKGTPLDPEEQKKLFFDRNAGSRPGLPLYKDSPNLYAQAVHAQQEYDARKTHYMTGESMPLRRILGMPEGQFAIKHDDGSVGVYSSDELAAKTTADKMGVNLIDVVMNDGIYRGKPQREVVDGVEYEVIPQKDLLRGKKLKPIRQFAESQLTRERIVDSEEKRAKIQMLREQRKRTDEQEKIYAAFLAGDETNRIYDSFKKKVLSGDMKPEIFANTLRDQFFPGQVVVLEGLDEDWSMLSWTGWNPGDNFVEGPEFRLKTRWGNKAITGKGMKIVVDRDGEAIYDEKLNPIPNVQGSAAINAFFQEQGGFEEGDATW